MFLKNFTNIFKLNSIKKLNLNKRYESTYPKYYDLKGRLFNEILIDELVFLFNVFKKNNYQLKIAGGAVRDLLLDKKPHDIDLASNALPEQMIEIFKKEKIRILNLNGLKHGTVPIRINDKVNYEITTLRLNPNLYGTQNETNFKDDWHKDAIRRDLTINALFLDVNGKVLDYVNGYEDLKNKIVRFVGIADKRVKEDYLRILRYFRFYSLICDNCEYHDEMSINAIRNNVEGLKGVTNERIGGEMRKILLQKFSDSFIKMFYELKIDLYLGLPSNPDLKKYNHIYNIYFKDNPNPKPIVMLSALVRNENEMNKVNERFKFSNDEKYLLTAINKYENILKQKNDVEILEYLRKEMADRKSNMDRPLRKEESIEIVKLLDKKHLIESIQNIIIPNFNLTSSQLDNHEIFCENLKKNIRINDYLLKNSFRIKYNNLLYDLKSKWIHSNFKLSEQELLKMVNKEFLNNYLIQKKQKIKK